MISYQSVVWRYEYTILPYSVLDSLLPSITIIMQDYPSKKEMSILTQSSPSAHLVHI